MMNENYKHYTDFLKDKKFIRWQLMPDEALDTYWQGFVDRNPHATKELQRAIVYLKTEGLNKSTLSGTERAQLLNKIQLTIQHDKRRLKNRRLMWYSVASSAAVAVLVIGITLFSSREKMPATAQYQELIIGELLNSEDIQLITSEEAISFQHNVAVKLDEKGTVSVTQSDTDEVKTVKISQEKMNSLIIPYGKRSSLTLSDGSKVWLNSGSVLEFPAQFTGRNREINLVSGEMYIEVTPDKKKPFYVHTSDFGVKVYGTAFNVSTYENTSPSVVLVEGSVALKTPGKKGETSLVPNQLAIYDTQTGTFSRQQVDVSSYTSWKEGYLILNNTPMTEILRLVGKYYNLSFSFEQDVNLQKRTCTGKIYLSENLDNVMTTIALLSSTRYERENNRIYFVPN